MADIIEKVMAKKKNQEKDPLHLQRMKASQDFWEYEKYINSNFFKESRPHLKEIAQTLQAFYECRIVKTAGIWQILSYDQKNNLIKSGIKFDICHKLMLNEPPRSGKSYTLSMFNQWCFGKEQTNKIIDVSYNETIAGRFSQTVRDGIDATKIDDSIHIFSDVFPKIKIKYGDSSKTLWSLENQYFSYLGTGFGGTITGIGCRIGIIDDPIKNHIEACNDTILDNHYSWYTDTFLSRIEEHGFVIIVMTRWSTKDLCGRLLQQESDEWYVIKQKACFCEEKGIMLCEELLSFKSYLSKKKTMSSAIFFANYQQEPVDIKGRLYSNFKTYNEELEFDKVVAYTDTADTGSDYLATYIFGIIGNEAYILHIIYTDKSMEYTETLLADTLFKYSVNVSVVESNNGGRGFARNVERIMKKKYGYKCKTVFMWLYQSKNKKARILSNANYIMENVYFPEGWENKYSDCYLALSAYQAAGKNKHDDAADGLTGVSEILCGDIKLRGNAKFVNVRVR